MKETKIYADEFCTTFASTTEMLEFLAERAKQSKWIRKPTRMLKLVPLEKEAETIEEACEKELEGIVEDTEKNTQLVLKVKPDEGKCNERKCYGCSHYTGMLTGSISNGRRYGTVREKYSCDYDISVCPYAARKV